MESWSIKDLKTWLNYFGKNKTANYFLGGPDEETIEKVKRILKEKLKKREDRQWMMIYKLVINLIL